MYCFFHQRTPLRLLIESKNNHCLTSICCQATREISSLGVCFDYHGNHDWDRISSWPFHHCLYISTAPQNRKPSPHGWLTSCVCVGCVSTWPRPLVSVFPLIGEMSVWVRRLFPPRQHADVCEELLEAAWSQHEANMKSDLLWCHCDSREHLRYKWPLSRQEAWITPYCEHSLACQLFLTCLICEACWHKQLHFVVSLQKKKKGGF